MINILITGGAGYIGSELVGKLISQKNYNVTVIDKLIFNQKSLDQFIGNKNFNFIRSDVRNKKVLKEHALKNDIIIPLAALVGAPICARFEKDAVEINYFSIKYLAEILRNEQKVIFPVTNSGYGIGKKDEMCTEESELNPLSIYGKTKVQAEKIILTRENSVAFRLATVFGWSNRMRIDLLVNNFVYLAYKKKFIKLFEPHFRRNYVHIMDVVNLILFTIKNFENLKSNTYNFGLSEGNLTKEQLCKKIQKHIVNFEYEISNEGTDEDKRDYFVSNQKIESKGFKAVNSLDYGISELINNYKLYPNKVSDNLEYVDLNEPI